MDKKTKLFAVVFALIAFVAVSTAMTYTNRADALADLGKATPQVFSEGECTIESVTETIDEGETSRKIRVDYIMTYKLDGELRDEYDYRILPNEDSKTVKDAIAARCEQRKAEITAVAQGNKIERVQIDYTQGNLSGLLEKYYSTTTRIWGIK